ncbi:MAG: hypothetical protein F4121_00410 [Acidimicrobiia bacterium]|nr:hypothetical protein [Acidimicrobiia bacterium]MYC45374.1 hypothetical protein [Acidimicrobiia bacterium]MYI18587.1 hypothetical protein [Acidimicrobiia bacterium]
MKSAISRIRRRHRTARRFLQQREDESGLTTLEWLLIVAAVAGLAALAVVLVQNVVGDTAEQISGSSARKTAALVAAEEIVNKANSNAADQPTQAKTYGDWAKYYKAKCNRIKITYGDAGIKPEPAFFVKSGEETADVVATAISTAASDAETDLFEDGTFDTGKSATAQCRISDAGAASADEE